MISVVIPTHNRSELLTRAVDSVRNQTIKEIEIIIISDGSTDDTDEIVNELINVDKRIRLISYDKPKGGNVARNKGIEASKYPYVAFLDDDDEWISDKLERQLEVFNDDDKVGLVYTGSNLIYVHENIAYGNEPVLQGDLSKTILLKNVIGTTSTVMVKKSVLNNSGYFDINLRALQDYDLWIRVCQVSEIGVVSKPLINYYNYTGKKQISQQTDKYEEAINQIEVKYKNLFTVLNEKEEKQRKNNFYLLLAHKAMRNGSRKTAIRYSLNALGQKLSIKSLIFFILSVFKYETTLKLRKKVKI